MECGPALSDAVLKLAAPCAFSEIVPNVELPSKNVAEPKGVPAVDVTWAVKVRTWPVVALGEEAVNETEVASVVTVTGVTVEVLGEMIADT
jgi:hypothetical protein